MNALLAASGVDHALPLGSVQSLLNNTAHCHNKLGQFREAAEAAREAITLGTLGTSIPPRRPYERLMTALLGVSE